MSAAAAWSYTAKATLWPLLARDGWSGGERFGAPVPIRCDYKAEARTLRDAKGVERATTLAIYTEHATAKPGDRVLIGASAATDPTVVPGAAEVVAVEQFADTFDRRADDFVLRT